MNEVINLDFETIDESIRLYNLFDAEITNQLRKKLTMRKLATIRRIAEIKPIEGADFICAYRVDGWWCVSKVDEFKVGDLVVYLEVDSWVPTEIAPFLSKGKEPKSHYSSGGYDYVSSTNYWDECIICGEHLNLKTEKGYFG